jgi:hypothetical protein
MIATVLLILGALATGSRTAVSMLIVELIVYLIRHRRETMHVLPALAPAIVVIHVFLPGSIGTFRQAFFPKGGLIAEQSAVVANQNNQLAGGRIRQLKPMVAEASRHPLFGEGLGTRITGFDVPQRNAPILDNQWLNNLLDVGYLGFGLWVWLFVSSVRRLFRRSRTLDEADPDIWLYDGLGAAIFAFAIGMFTFDAFSFTQIFFIFWIVLGLSAALLAVPETSPAAVTEPERRPRPIGPIVDRPVPAPR